MRAKCRIYRLFLVALRVVSSYANRVTEGYKMSQKTTIEWTQQTWNPVIGCKKVSPGCQFCYADAMARRLKAMGAKGYEQGFKPMLRPEKVGDPLRRRKPTVYFVNSMSDLFLDEIPDDFIEQVMTTIEITPQHTYQILTKRADRLAQFFMSRKPPANAWLGVTVENRKHGLPRIDHLRRTSSAAIRFLSIEPLLEDLGSLDLTGINWVIVGGESGPHARPMDPRWATGIQIQCQNARVAFFFKQWGTFGHDGVRRYKKANGDHLLGRTWKEYPKELPA